MAESYIGTYIKLAFDEEDELVKYLLNIGT